MHCCLLASLALVSLPLQAQNAPPPPTNVHVSGLTSSGAVLRWNKSPGAASYEVLTYGGAGWVDVGDVNSYTYTGLTADTIYDLAVRAKNTGGTSAIRIVVIYTLPESGIPVLRFPSAPPHRVLSDITHKSAVLSWTKVFNATSYEVTGGALSRWVDIGNVNRYTFICLAGNTEYTLQIRSKNSLGTSGAERVTLTTLVIPPDTNTPVACDPYPREKSKREPTATPTFTPSPKPPVYTLNQLPPEIQVSNWVEGAQGRRVGSDAISRADLIAQGVVDAVDVYGYVTPGIEVCFKRQGRVVFLDAAYAPRRLSDLPSYQRAEMTCAIIDRAGTVVLLRGDSPPPQEPQPPPQNTPPANTNPNQEQSLGDYEVQPFANLKFRQSPSDGLVLGVTSRRDWLPASDKRDGYFKVSLWRIEGWISGDYVNTRGHCGA